MARECFVLMPFAKEFDAIWQFVVRTTVEAQGDTCRRADDFFRPGNILADVLGSIRRADYLIADLTTRNPNVFYELGIAHAIKKPVILVSQERDRVPFDVASERIVFYQDTAAGLEQLRTGLTRAVAAIPTET